MILNDWIRKWVKIKIKYYEMYLKNNLDSPLRKEVEEYISSLRELI